MRGAACQCGLFTSLLLFSFLSFTAAVSFDLTELRNKVAKIKVNPRGNLWATGKNHDRVTCFIHMNAFMSLSSKLYLRVAFMLQGISWARRAWWIPPCCPPPRPPMRCKWRCRWSRARSESFSRSCCASRYESRWRHETVALRTRWGSASLLLLDGLRRFTHIFWTLVSGGGLADEDFRKLHSKQKMSVTASGPTAGRLGWVRLGGVRLGGVRLGSTQFTGHNVLPCPYAPLILDVLTFIHLMTSVELFIFNKTWFALFCLWLRS